MVLEQVLHKNTYAYRCMSRQQMSVYTCIHVCVYKELRKPTIHSKTSLLFSEWHHFILLTRVCFRVLWLRG